MMLGLKMRLIVARVIIAALMLINVQQVNADLVTFDFANGNGANNSQNGGDGNWTPFANETTPVGVSASTTINGLGMTIMGVANGGGDDTWGINVQGIGIHSDDMIADFGRQIDGSIGEAITFTFDQDISLSSIRFGSFFGDFTDTEDATISVSGGPTITISSFLEDINQPMTDFSLGDTFVSFETLVTLTTSHTIGAGVLFLEITVNTQAVPEPGLLSFMFSSVVGFFLTRRRRDDR